MSNFEKLSDEIEATAKMIVSSAFKVHNSLGPGLLESVYELCLSHELQKNKLNVRRQVDIPLEYDGIIFDTGFRLDMLVNDKIIIEIKAVEEMNPVFEAQILTYLKLTGKRLGFLINFNTKLIKHGIKRIIL